MTMTMRIMMLVLIGVLVTTLGATTRHNSGGVAVSRPPKNLLKVLLETYQIREQLRKSSRNLSETY